MAVAAAESLHIPYEAELYARSLTTIFALGRVVAGDRIPPESEGIVEEGRRNFVSAVEENLATDPEYGEDLIFDPMRPFDIIDGHVVDCQGKNIIELVENGWEASRQAAAHNPEMAIQAERDEGDVEVARIVDSLEVGEVYAVVSMEPKEALLRNPKYWEGQGYRKGMAVAQVYYRSSDSELLGGAYAIKHSNRRILREIFAGLGADIPKGESENRWIRHGLRFRADNETAEQLGGKLVAAHREQLGKHAKILSATRIVADNEQLVNTQFENYIVPLAVAYANHAHHPVIQELAAAMLQGPTSFNSKSMRHIVALASGLPPDRDATVFMENSIRYALVEELRKQIPGYLVPDVKPIVLGFTYHGNPHEAHLNIVNNIDKGVAAGRSYGGCTPAEIEEQDQTERDSLLGKQDIFGGKAKLPDDKYGTRYFRCPKNGCPNERPKDTLLPKCLKCGAKIPRC